jgi:hypothetical protein
MADGLRRINVARGVSNLFEDKKTVDPDPDGKKHQIVCSSFTGPAGSGNRRELYSGKMRNYSTVFTVTE